MSVLSKFVRSQFAKPANAITPGAVDPNKPFTFDAEEWAKAAAPVALAAVGGGVLGGGASGAAGAAGSVPSPKGSSSATGWLSKTLGGIEGADWLSAIGSGIGGYMDAEAAAKAIAEGRRQFDLGLGQRQAEAATASGQFDRNFNEDQARFNRTTGNTEAQLAVQAETAMNKAPLADKAQALLLSRMGVAPSSFQPRDITKGIPQFRAGASGGPSTVTQQLQKAASGYTPGQGGVDTSALRLLQQRMLAGGKQQNPGAVEAPPRLTRPGLPGGTAPRPPLMLPATTEPTEELLTRPGTLPVSRRPMGLR